MKTVGKVAGVVAAVAMIGSGIGAALGGTMMLSILGTSIAAGTIASVAGAISMGATLLTKPKAPEIGAANTDRLNVSINVRAHRVMALGRTALATDLRDQEFTGADKEYLHRFILSAAHRLNAIEEIWFDDQLAWTVAGGVQGVYAGYLQVTPILEGTPGNAINISSRMGSSRRFTGCAYVHLRFKLTGNGKKTESPFAQQVPTRLTIVGEGMPCYDVRQDSTRGGSGAHRADDQSTWTYGPHARNNACQWATWLLGWRIQNPQSGAWKLSVGCGIQPDRIDWSSVIDAANICDEPVALAAGGTEPRYRGDGLFDESMGPLRINEAFKASMNADVDDQDGLLRLTVFHNDLATPDADFDTSDIQGDYVWLQTRPPHESFNLVRGTYIEPDARSLYQPAPYREVSIAAAAVKERVHPADFGHVQSKGQAERLAKQRLQRQLYGGEFRATFLASGWKVHKNSVVRLTFAPEGWVNKLFRVVETDPGRHDGLVPMVLREEHAQIYAWDSEESPPVAIAEPTLYLPGETPVAQFLGTIEEGATVGATIGENLKDDGGNVVDPGAIANDAISLDPDGRLSFQPLVGVAVELGQITLPGLGAAPIEDMTGALVQVLQNQLLVEQRKALLDARTLEGDVKISAIVRRVDRERIEGDEALAESVSLVGVAVETVDTRVTAEVATLEQAIADGDSASATALNLVKAELESDIGVVDTRVTAEVATLNQAIADGDGALATQLTSVSAVANAKNKSFSQASAPTASAVGDLWFDTDDANKAHRWDGSSWVATADTRIAANAAAIVTEQTARADGDGALATQITSVSAVANAKNKSFSQASAPTASAVGDLWFDIDDANKAYRWDGSSWVATSDTRIATNAAAIQTEQTARADGDSALAGQISTVSTTVNGHTASITQHASSIDGLELRQGFRLDVNGYITGYIQNNDGTQGDFTIVTDKFMVVPPGGGTAVAAFVIDGGNVALGGSLKVGGNLIVGGTVVTDKLAANAVTELASAYSDSAISLASGSNSVTVQTLAFTANGLPVVLSAGANVAIPGFNGGSFFTGTIDIQRNGTSIFSGPALNPSSIPDYGFYQVVDQPPAGACTYTFIINRIDGTADVDISKRLLSKLELKR